MTAFDIMVLVIVGIAAIAGFLRGFVQEVLSLSAWIMAVLAIHYLHTDLTEIIYRYLGGPQVSAVLAFIILLLVPYIVMKLIAKRVGRASRTSVLGPIDRVLGFGFGAVKGIILVVLAYSLVMLASDSMLGPKNRPHWITHARSYQFVDAASKELVLLIQARRHELQQAASGVVG